MKLTKDEYWQKWILYFYQRAQEDEFHCVLVSTNSYTQCRPGLDQDLWNRQECFLGLVLEFTLETDMGIHLFTIYQKCPCNVFFKLQEYHCSSPLSLLASQDIIAQLHSLNINTFPTVRPSSPPCANSFKIMMISPNYP